VSAAIVDVRAASGADAPSTDPLLDAWLTNWQREIDRALGEVVAVSTTGLGRESGELARWVLRSWLEQVEAEVAVTTRGSIRQELPAGPITVATIHSILPFENELVVASVPGAMLRAMAAEPATRMMRVARRPDGRIRGLRELTFDDERLYRVVTTDFLYDGGDDCPFRTADPNARRTGLHWRAPVVSWTRSLGSSPAKPLESLLRAAEGARSTP
jgi:2',3'-cyclic-nucleotide 2'-phosphodiesterase (5'-nucleotidase family)